MTSWSQLPGAAASAVLTSRAEDRGCIAVDGADRASWLNGVVTADVLAFSSGRVAYGLALNRTGKIQGDLYCLEAQERILIAAPKATIAALLEQWDRMLVMEDAELSDRSSELSWFFLFGSAHAAAAERLASANNGAWGALDPDWVDASLVAVPADVDVGTTLVGSKPLESGALRELRLERLWPEYGLDFGSDDRPHEASLDRRAVSWTKGCYLGQEVVCMQEMRGKVKRKLTVLMAEAPFVEMPRAGDALVCLEPERHVVGQVTSAVDSRRLERGLVMARLDVSALEGAVHLERAAGDLPLSIVDEPL